MPRDEFSTLIEMMDLFSDNRVLKTQRRGTESGVGRCQRILDSGRTDCSKIANLYTVPVFRGCTTYSTPWDVDLVSPLVSLRSSTIYSTT